MSAPRPHEALAVLRAAEDLASADPSGVLGVLATLVTLDGAAAERSGAMLLLGDETVAALPGVTPLAAVPAALREGAEAALAQGSPRLVELDLAEDDALFGAGGLLGRAEVWLEPLDGALREALRPWREALLQGDGAVIECVLAGPAAGRRRLLGPDDEEARECWRAEEPELEETASGGRVSRVFRAPYAPMGKALLLGSGDEIRRLAGLLDGLGFVVTVADPRPGRLRGEGWDRARWRLVEGGWEAARLACRPDESTSIVVGLRSHAEDLKALKGALLSPARYVGLAGPAARGARLLAELREAGVEAAPGVLSAPAGLDIGAEAAEETALALAAEILAVRAGRRGGRPGRLRPLGSSPSQRKGGVRIPGLVLAAGRGKRFGAVSKLLADVDGQPVLRHVVEAALAAKLDPVIVVLGAGAEAGLQAIEGLDDERLRVVFNPSWKSGKASSIETGLREVPPDAPGVVALLGDMPRVPTWLIERVRSEFELSGRLAFPVFPGPDGPVKGHPTAYPRELFGEVGQLVGDDTALEAARRHWTEAVKIPLEDGRTQADIDTAADLELLKVRPDAQGRLL
ncbi:MAG: NTP transferase domain-containing protein [Elusimicrobiota bacterium]|nr:NTP transferase domain-containing protein [Elusimicrobiota bacterium]